MLEFTLDEKVLGEAFFERASGLPAEAIFAIDRRGRVLRQMRRAEQLLAARPGSSGQSLIRDLKPILRAAFEHVTDVPKATPKVMRQAVDSGALGRQSGLITSLVFRNRNPIGVIVVLPLGGSAQTRSQVSDRKADLRGSKD